MGKVHNLLFHFLFINIFVSQSKEASVFTYQYLSARAPIQSQEKGLIIFNLKSKT